MRQKITRDDPLNEDVRNAESMGLSYGYYKLYQRMNGKTTPILPRGKINRALKTQSDITIFKMWQSGHTDTEIANTIGVSRQRITSWRNKRSLPCQKEIESKKIDTTDYHIMKDRDGKMFIYHR